MESIGIKRITFIRQSSRSSWRLQTPWTNYKQFHVKKREEINSYMFSTQQQYFMVPQPSLAHAKLRKQNTSHASKIIIKSDCHSMDSDNTTTTMCYKHILSFYTHIYRMCQKRWIPQQHCDISINKLYFEPRPSALAEEAIRHKPPKHCFKITTTAKVMHTSKKKLKILAWPSRSNAVTTSEQFYLSSPTIEFHET
jgi:hypothetical protein